VKITRERIASGGQSRQLRPPESDNGYRFFRVDPVMMRLARARRRAQAAAGALDRFRLS
jgi:hypothetical protein